MGRQGKVFIQKRKFEGCDGSGTYNLTAGVIFSCIMLVASARDFEMVGSCTAHAVWPLVSEDLRSRNV